jgi:hypothetical protein
MLDNYYKDDVEVTNFFYGGNEKRKEIDLQSVSCTCTCNCSCVCLNNDARWSTGMSAATPAKDGNLTNTTNAS